MKALRAVKDWTLMGLNLIGGVLIVVFMSPVLLLSVFRDRKIKREGMAEYKAYLKEHEGAKFFCYGHNWDSNTYVEQHILPGLSPDISIVKIDGSLSTSLFERRYIIDALEGAVDKRGFPYLFKVADGRLIDQSIKQEFFSTMHQAKNASGLLEIINRFYEGA